MSAPTPEFSPDELTELLTAYMPDIPGYRVMRRLGRGGMSYVYLGLQESLDRQVAIKVISPDALKDEVSKARFEKEAHTIAKLQHPCIVNIYEVGRTDYGLLYYVMPYLPRGHLGQRDLRNDDAAIIAVLRALLWALDYAHVRGVVHRDVKAENVLFDNVDRPLLTDFGIAINKRDRSRMTGGGQAVGSGSHMAPEQARGEKVDGRADLYSVGVLAYELLTGELPYKNNDSLGLALMHAVDPIPRLPATKQRWQSFIDKAMAKTPATRFADAQEMMAALDRVEVALLRAARPRTTPASLWRAARAWVGGLPSTWQSPRPGWLQLPRIAALPPRLRRSGAMVAAALVLLIALFSWPDRDPPPTPSEPIVSSPPRPPPIVTANIPAPEPTASEPAPDAAESAPDPVIELEPVAEPTVVELAPGERELAAAAEQIRRRRLSLPAGNNALESLLAAQVVLPDSPRLRQLGSDWLSAATPYLQQALREHRNDAARALLDKAQRLQAALQLADTPAWEALQQALAAPLQARLGAALARQDPAALDAVKAEIQSWGLAPSRFEPQWSQQIVRASAGDRVAGPGRPVLLLRPEGARPGLALMPRAVTRDEYAEFARASRRPASSCRIRTAVLTLKKRRWDDPGFKQAPSHPVVCVSRADAQAYADWLSQREGRQYRLPTQTEWQQWIASTPRAPGCAAGTRCERNGTAPAASGSASELSIHNEVGNVREWPGDCRGDCKRQPTLGVGWRDVGAKRIDDDDTAVDPRQGYDDVGFRLVREVERSELESR